jgi:hypothetical protein
MILSAREVSSVGTHLLMEHCIKFQKMKILARIKGYMDCLLKEVTKISLGTQFFISSNSQKPKKGKEHTAK